MNFLNPAPSHEIAVKNWNGAQFDLSDVILSLTDNGLEVGAKMFLAFKNPAFLKLMEMYSCDFESMKKYLGIEGDYVIRAGDVYSADFNPKRNPSVLTLSKDEMSIRADKLYEKLIDEFKAIVKKYSDK